MENFDPFEALNALDEQQAAQHSENNHAGTGSNLWYWNTKKHASQPGQPPVQVAFRFFPSMKQLPIAAMVGRTFEMLSGEFWPEGKPKTRRMYSGSPLGGDCTILKFIEENVKRVINDRSPDMLQHATEMQGKLQPPYVTGQRPPFKDESDFYLPALVCENYDSFQGFHPLDGEVKVVRMNKACWTAIKSLFQISSHCFRVDEAGNKVKIPSAFANLQYGKIITMKLEKLNGKWTYSITDVSQQQPMPAEYHDKNIDLDKWWAERVTPDTIALPTLKHYFFNKPALSDKAVNEIWNDIKDIRQPATQQQQAPAQQQQPDATGIVNPPATGGLASLLAD